MLCLKGVNGDTVNRLPRSRNACGVRSGPLLPRSRAVRRWVLCCSVPWGCRSGSTWRGRRRPGSLGCHVSRGLPVVLASRGCPGCPGGRSRQSHEDPGFLWRERGINKIEDLMLIDSSHLLVHEETSWWRNKTYEDVVSSLRDFRHYIKIIRHGVEFIEVWLFPAQGTPAGSTCSTIIRPCGHYNILISTSAPFICSRRDILTQCSKKNSIPQYIYLDLSHSFVLSSLYALKYFKHQIIGIYIFLKSQSL